MLLNLLLLLIWNKLSLAAVEQLSLLLPSHEAVILNLWLTLSECLRRGEWLLLNLQGGQGSLGNFHALRLLQSRQADQTLGQELALLGLQQWLRHVLLKLGQLVQLLLLLLELLLLKKLLGLLPLQILLLELTHLQLVLLLLLSVVLHLLLNHLG